MNQRELAKCIELMAELGGQTVPAGTVVGLSTDIDGLTLRLLRYEGDVAVCESVTGEITRHPKSTVFDANVLYRKMMAWAATDNANFMLSAATN